MNSSNPVPPRKIRLSITTGNAIRFAGIAAAGLALNSARSIHSKPAATLAMVAAWILLYLSCHAAAHWAAGRLLGIRFAFYTVGGTGNPQGYPPAIRGLFERLPFLGVQTEKASMTKASARAKAIMWSAGVTSSAIVPALGAVCAWRAGIPGSQPFLIFAACWALGTFSSNWRSETGDYAKARRALQAR